MTLYQDEEKPDEDLGKAFRSLITNEILFNTLPGIRTSMEHCPLLSKDAEFMDVYTTALAVKDSLIASVRFLKEVKTKVWIDKLYLSGDFYLYFLKYVQNYSD